MAEKPIFIHGDRICPVCKGILGEKAYRTPYGKRQTYYCWEHLPDWRKESGSYEEVYIIQKFDKNPEKIEEEYFTMDNWEEVWLGDD